MTKLSSHHVTLYAKLTLEFGSNLNLFSRHAAHPHAFHEIHHCIYYGTTHLIYCASPPISKVERRLFEPTSGRKRRETVCATLLALAFF